MTTFTAEVLSGVEVRSHKFTHAGLSRRTVPELVKLAETLGLIEREIYRYMGGPLPKAILVYNIEKVLNA